MRDTHSFLDRQYVQRSCAASWKKRCRSGNRWRGNHW